MTEIVASFPKFGRAELFVLQASTRQTIASKSFGPPARQCDVVNGALTDSTLRCLLSHQELFASIV